MIIIVCFTLKKDSTQVLCVRSLKHFQLTLYKLRSNILIMAPIAIEAIDPNIKDVEQPHKDNLELPDRIRTRLEKAGVDLSGGYSYRPLKPLYLDDVYNIRSKDREYIDAGSRADRDKTALLSAASEVVHLTTNIGTEIRGLQLKDLTNQ